MISPLHWIWMVPAAVSLVLMGLLSGAWLLRPIDPADYPQQVDYGTLNDAEREAFDAILAAAARGEPVVRWGKPINHYKLLTHLGMYFGKLDGVGRLFVVVNGDFRLNLEAFGAFERNRAEVDTLAEQGLRHIREGSDRYKLRQIARYLADRFRYCEDFRCGAYGILFYKMAARLGIESYLCFGFAGENLHVWNCAGGRYYDVTWLSAGGQYLQSPTAWGRTFALNDLWAGLEQEGR